MPRHRGNKPTPGSFKEGNTLGKEAAANGRRIRRGRDDMPILIPEETPDGEVVTLSRDHRVVLQMAVAGASVADIARQTGYEKRHIQAILKGERVPQLRRVFTRLLEMEGITLDQIAKKAAHLWNAEKAQWNRAKEDWDMFPDNIVQASTWRHITMLTNLMPENQVQGHGGVTVNIATNFGDPAPAEGHESTFTIDVPAEEVK